MYRNEVDIPLQIPCNGECLQNEQGSGNPTGPLFMFHHILALIIRIDTSHPIEEEWKRIERTCTEVVILFFFLFQQLQNEIRCYSGREQQKKGTITRNAQRTLFGEELPRGHGYKGKLSTKLSSLYDELMGRNPRKRQGRSTESSPLSTSKRLLLCSHRSPVGVIGNGPFACLLVERLLSKHHHVVLTHKETFSYVQSDASFTSQLALLPVTALQYQPSLPSFLSQCEVIFVSVQNSIMFHDFRLRLNLLPFHSIPMIIIFSVQLLHNIQSLIVVQEI